jgi:hypothetical protein
MYHAWEGWEMRKKIWSIALETKSTLRIWLKFESDIQNDITGMGI